ncbi:MAG TPA: hypothetical protein VMZ04_01235 [Anaerolineae bacterium]|nr:hypothetical protein [Anaerolineae bacterium]
MKFLVRLLVLLTVAIFALVTLIKIVERCSWKEAIGIVEELWKECKECCP